MSKNKIFATVEKIIRSKIWLAADQRKFYLPVELWPNAKIGEKIEICSCSDGSANDLYERLEKMIN